MESLDKNRIYEFEGLVSSRLTENIHKKVFLTSVYYPSLFTVSPNDIPPGTDHLPIVDSLQFVSTIVNNGLEKDQHKVDAEEMNFKNNIEFLSPLINVLSELGIGFFLNSLVRIKTNFIPINEKNYGNIHVPHVDLKDKENCWTMIYYVNSNNGKTHFLKKDKEGKFNIYKSVIPKQGKCVFFHSSNFHCGSVQNDKQYRAVINYNYII